MPEGKVKLESPGATGGPQEPEERFAEFEDKLQKLGYIITAQGDITTQGEMLSRLGNEAIVKLEVGNCIRKQVLCHIRPERCLLPGNAGRGEQRRYHLQ